LRQVGIEINLAAPNANEAILPNFGQSEINDGQFASRRDDGRAEPPNLKVIASLSRPETNDAKWRTLCPNLGKPGNLRCCNLMGRGS
jgi:hypothetical protein